MKLDEIYKDDMNEDLDMKPPVKKLSPEMEARKKADQDKIRAERDWSTRSRGSRLTGRGRGTARADQSFKEV